jgi:hypothetical protein
MVQDSEHTFTVFAHSTLRCFHRDLLHLFRTLDSHHTRQALVELMERTTDAIVAVEDRERIMILHTLCCA